MRFRAGRIAAGASTVALAFTGILTTQVPASADTPAVDVLFIFDVTGSMGGAIAEAKAQVLDSAASIRTEYPDSQFAVASVADYPPDTPWMLNQPLTSDLTAVQGAVSPLYASGGGDGPEAYTRALYEAAQPAIGWRSGARHLVVLVNDNLPHDTDLNEGVPADIQTHWSPFNTGVDPGPDGIPGTADDLDWQDTLALLKSSGIVFASVLYSGSSDYLPYWEWWTKQTGGLTAIGGLSTPLGEILTELVLAGAGVDPGTPLVISTRVLDESWTDPGTAAYVKLQITVTRGSGSPAAGASVRLERDGFQKPFEYTVDDDGVRELVMQVGYGFGQTVELQAEEGAAKVTRSLELYSDETSRQCIFEGKPERLNALRQLLDMVGIPGIKPAVDGWIQLFSLSTEAIPSRYETRVTGRVITGDELRTIYNLRISAKDVKTGEIVTESNLYSHNDRLLDAVTGADGPPLQAIARALQCGSGIA